MYYSKKYFIGANMTAGHLTEILTREELLPKNYFVKTFAKLQDLQTFIDITENKDIFCGAIVSMEDISFPLSEKYETYQFTNHIHVILVED